MCTVISGDCGCGRGSSSSGVTAEGFLATGAILAGVAIAGAVFEVLWVPLGVALLVGWIMYSRRARRVTFVVCALFAAGVVGLVRLAVKRRRKAKPTKAVATARQWQVTLYTTVGGRNEILGSTPVAGYWSDATELQEDAMRRYVAAHGYPAAGTLCCRADPVT